MTHDPQTSNHRETFGVLLVVLAGLVFGTAPPADLAASSPAIRKSPASRLQPSELTYLGAFRLPEVATGVPAIWDWGGQAMTYYPGGDPGGGSDGFPGSLFATGLDTDNYVSEFSIPAPSLSRNVGALPVATTLQEFADVRAGLFASFDEMPLASIEYLPAQVGQSSDQLYLAWGQHLHSASAGPTHAWCDLDLDHPATRGAWWIGDAATAAAGFIYSVDAYLFAIPDAWADAHAGGMKLATGRFRDGGWSGTGPSLIACGPWLDGTPPPPGAELSYRTLLLYSHTRGGAPPTSQRLEGYSDADAWNGGAWITAGTKSAVVFAGTKGSGYTWYGFTTPSSVATPPLFGEGSPCPFTAGEIMCYQPDGETPCTPQELDLCTGAAVEEASRGWWASRFDAELIFYDPDDLAAVAAGTMEPFEPQPYAALDIDEHLFLNATMADVTMYIGHGNQRNSRLGEPAYDRANGRLYLLELFADDYRPVVHVFAVEAGAPTTYQLMVDKRGSGSGTVTSTPPGIQCGNDCTHDYAAGTAVTLMATPDAGSTFTGWNGACTGTGSCSVTMSSERTVRATFAGVDGCVTGADHLCLSGSRFRVEVTWRDFQGNTGSAQVVPYGSDDSGLFWFFDADNWEMLVKVLDGCPVNDRYWVFSAATTNVEYTLRVTDTQTGIAREYRNPLGTSAPAVTDATAFATCSR